MNLRARLYNVYWALRRIIAPNLRYSQYLYEDILKQYVRSQIQWLDLGCGHSLLPSWREEEERRLVQGCQRVVGIDYDFESLKVHPTLSDKLRGDITTLPFKSESFDLTTANMVVEHLDNPLRQFREINRCLKPNGVFIFHTPNALDYGVLLVKLVPERFVGTIVQLLEGRQSQDVFKTYYRANTEKAITALARETGFEVVAIHMVNTDAIFAMVPPLAIVELLWLRLLMTKPFRPFRNNIIAVLQKVASLS